MDKLVQQIKVLSKTELQEINSIIDSFSDRFTQSTVFTNDDSGNSILDASYRTSWGTGIEPGSGLEQKIHSAMDRGLVEYRKRLVEYHEMFQYWPVPFSTETFCGREDIQVLQYSPGQEYVFHHDQSDYINNSAYYRTLSTILYLNDDFDGGGTAFPHKTFKPKAGHALFFPSNWCYPHSGQKVISGSKRVAVTWWYCIREKEG
jgi:hypothetical protein